MVKGCSYQTENFENGSDATQSKTSDDDADIELENSTKKNSKNSKKSKKIDNEDEDDDEDEYDTKSKKTNRFTSDKGSKNKKNEPKESKKSKKSKKSSYGSMETESFENMLSSLSVREKKLLQSFKKGELSDDEIDGLIETGVINESLVEKFLEHVEKENFTNPKPKKLEESFLNIEAFTNNNYTNYY
jgi:hypothetical protein